MLTDEKIIEKKKLFLNLLYPLLETSNARHNNLKNTHLDSNQVNEFKNKMPLSDYSSKCLLAAYQTALADPKMTQYAKREEFEEIITMINRYIDTELTTELLKTTEEKVSPPAPPTTNTHTTPLINEAWPCILSNIRRLDNELPVKNFYELYALEIKVAKYSVLGVVAAAMVTGFTIWALGNENNASPLPSPPSFN